MTETSYESNNYADFWRCDIGANVIPANTREKKPNVEWKQWQDNPIPQQLHDRWKSENRFSDGMAVIAGRVWHNKHRKHLYLICIDADNAKAIQELCFRNGKGSITLRDLANWTLVEQHLDDPNKAHIYIYSNKPFAKKSSDNIITNNIKNNNADCPLIEVKGLGEHGIMFCSPSIHKNGHCYEILGIRDPALADDYEHHIDTFLEKYGISYLGNGNGKPKSKSQIPIEDLFKPGFKVRGGNNRHEDILRVMESLIARNARILEPDMIKRIAADWNNQHCLPPLDPQEFERQWKDASKFIAKANSSGNNIDRFLDSDYWDGNWKDKNTTSSSELEEDERLASDNKLTDADIDFVINTIKKEAEYDELSIKQLVYGMSSAFTKVPIHHIVNSKDAGAGKSYLLNLVGDYFPDKYVIAQVGMSDKSLFHRAGLLVIENKDTGELEPIGPIIDRLESEMEELEGDIESELDKDSIARDKTLVKANNNRIKEIESEIKDIHSHALKRIDLNNQIILCLDTPQDSLYDALMSVISQDTPKDQKYSFVEKSGSGRLGTKDNILRGVPSFFTTQVIDDTKKVRYEEKNRRFVHVTPDTSREKIRAANILTGHRDGLLEEEYDELVVSREDKERAKQILKILVAKLKQHSKHFQPKHNGVKIPFEEAITHSIPDDHLWDMTVTNRTTKYLAIITKTRMDDRSKIVNEDTGQFYPIATFEDLKEAFKLMQIGASGVRPYLSSWYNKYFIPAIDTLGGKPIEDKDDKDATITKERYVGLTNKRLAEITHTILGGPKMGTDELYNKYLSPLINLGIIDKARSVIDSRENIYFPVEDDKAKRVGNLFSMFENDKDLRLKVSNPDILPSKTFLKEKFRILSKYRQRENPLLKKNFKGYKLLDLDVNEITVDQLLALDSQPNH